MSITKSIAALPVIMTVSAFGQVAPPPVSGDRTGNPATEDPERGVRLSGWHIERMSWPWTAPLPNTPSEPGANHYTLDCPGYVENPFLGVTPPQCVNGGKLDYQTAEGTGIAMPHIYGLDPQFVDDILQQRYYDESYLLDQFACCQSLDQYQNDTNCALRSMAAVYSYNGPSGFTIENSQAVFGSNGHNEEFDIEWDYGVNPAEQVGSVLGVPIVPLTQYVAEGSDLFADNGDPCLANREAYWIFNPTGGPVPGTAFASGEVLYAIWFEPRFWTQNAGRWGAVIRGRMHLTFFYTSTTPNGDSEALPFDYVMFDFVSLEDEFDGGWSSTSGGIYGPLEPDGWSFHLNEAGIRVCRSKFGMMESVELLGALGNPIAGCNREKMGIIRTPLQ